jgi:hypothetical protein
MSRMPGGFVATPLGAAAAGKESLLDRTRRERQEREAQRLDDAARERRGRADRVVARALRRRAGVRIAWEQWDRALAAASEPPGPRRAWHAPYALVGRFLLLHVPRRRADLPRLAALCRRLLQDPGSPAYESLLAVPELIRSGRIQRQAHALVRACVACMSSDPGGVPYLAGPELRLVLLLTTPGSWRVRGLPSVLDNPDATAAAAALIAEWKAEWTSQHAGLYANLAAAISKRVQLARTAKARGDLKGLTSLTLWLVAALRLALPTVAVPPAPLSPTKSPASPVSPTASSGKGVPANPANQAAAAAPAPGIVPSSLSPEWFAFASKILSIPLIAAVTDQTGHILREARVLGHLSLVPVDKIPPQGLLALIANSACLLTHSAADPVWPLVNWINSAVVRVGTFSDMAAGPQGASSVPASLHPATSPGVGGGSKVFHPILGWCKGMASLDPSMAQSAPAMIKQLQLWWARPTISHLLCSGSSSPSLTTEPKSNAPPQLSMAIPAVASMYMSMTHTFRALRQDILNSMAFHPDALPRLWNYISSPLSSLFPSSELAAWRKARQPTSLGNSSSPASLPHLPSPDSLRPRLLQILATHASDTFHPTLHVLDLFCEAARPLFL